MKKVRFICSFFVLIAVLFSSSCNVEENSSTMETTQKDTEVVDKGSLDGPVMGDECIVYCHDEKEYLAFLESDQCPAQFCIPLSFFEDFGMLQSFILYRYENADAPYQFYGDYRFECKDILVGIHVVAGCSLSEWWQDPFYEEISDENMPENFVLGKSISSYWLWVLGEEVKAGKIEDPFNGSESYNYMKGNYYSINEKVRVGYDGYYTYGYWKGNGPTIHLNVDDIQIWIAPMQNYQGNSTATLTDVYEMFREASPLMDRLLTKSTSQAAAEELYNLWKDALN